MTHTRDILYVNCISGDHVWKFMGGASAGCHDDCCCSIPVHQCEHCGDFDYGINAEAVMIIDACETRKELLLAQNQEVAEGGGNDPHGDEPSTV